MNFKILLQKSLQFLASYWDACDSNASEALLLHQGSPLSACHDFVRIYKSPQCSHDKLAQAEHPMAAYLNQACACAAAHHAQLSMMPQVRPTSVGGRPELGGPNSKFQKVSYVNNIPMICEAPVLVQEVSSACKR